jgi:hypothetical protein
MSFWSKFCRLTAITKIKMIAYETHHNMPQMVEHAYAFGPIKKFIYGNEFLEFKIYDYGFPNDSKIKFKFWKETRGCFGKGELLKHKNFYNNLHNHLD